jgi:hypothetical protein
VEFSNFGWTAAVALLVLIAIISDLRTVLDIQLTSWSLRKQKVSEDEIHKIAIAKAKRHRPNLAVQLLTLLIKLWKKK